MYLLSRRARLVLFLTLTPSYQFPFARLLPVSSYLPHFWSHFIADDDVVNEKIRFRAGSRAAGRQSSARPEERLRKS